jgi:alpha-2-macroglobulin
MSMMANDPADPRIETLFSDFMSAATFSGTASATGIHWEDRPDYYNWTTDIRTSALVMMALMHHDVENELLPSAVRWLMTARKADAWETTQETAWAVMALTDWMILSQELEANHTYAVNLNGEALLPEDIVVTSETVRESQQLRVEIEELLRDEANRLVINRGEGPGNLYYTVHLTTFLHVPDIEPVSRGIAIERQYHLASDPDRTPITSAQVGDEVIVTLTITAMRGLHYAVIEDPIPAGSEAVDPRLLTNSTIGQRPYRYNENPLVRGWGWWWFSHTELRDEKLVLYATYLPPGTYTYVYRIRLGLPGQFNVIPTTGQEFYFPEVYGRSDGVLFTIEP